MNHLFKVNLSIMSKSSMYQNNNTSEKFVCPPTVKNTRSSFNSADEKAKKRHNRALGTINNTKTKPIAFNSIVKK